MNRITEKFNELKSKNKTAFIGYVTAGDPSIQKTAEIVLALEKGGADIIEIGIPYSDPLADGPVIQNAGLRSFAGGFKVAQIFECAEQIRTASDVPLIVMVYYNTIYNIGNWKFAEKCKIAGIDGIIVPDLPLEERDELKVFTDEMDICLIPLVAPTSLDRIEDIAKDTTGFLYCVSTMGVTGMRDSYKNDVVSYLQSVKAKSTLPIAVGFGVSSREKVDYFSKYADGVIVGSAIVNKMHETNADAKSMEEFIKELTAGIK